MNGKITGALAAIFVVATAGTAAAQTRNQLWDRCQLFSSDGVIRPGTGPDLAIGACTQLIQSGQETNANLSAAFNNRGTAHNNKQEYDLAIADFNQAIALNVNDAQAYYNRGIAYDHKNQLDLAIDSYNGAIAHNPNYYQAYNNRGYKYELKHDLQRALADYSQAISHNANYERGILNRASLYVQMKQYDAGIGDYTRAISAMLHFRNHPTRCSIGSSCG